MKKTLIAIALAIACVFTVGLASPASADDVPVNPESIDATTSPTSFALVCNFPSPSVNARARVDFTGFDVQNLRTRVDADDIWYRSLKQSTNTAATFTPDRVEIDLFDDFAAHWQLWTQRGNNLQDGSTVPASTHWNPGAKNDLGSTYTRIKMVAWSLGGTSCSSPITAIS